MAVSSLKFSAFNASGTRDQYQFLLGQKKEALIKRQLAESTAIKTKPIAKAPPVVQPPIIDRPIVQLPPVAEGPFKPIGTLPPVVEGPFKPIAKAPPVVQPPVLEKPIVQLPPIDEERYITPIDFPISSQKDLLPANPKAQEKLQAVFEKLSTRFDVASRAYQVAALPKQFEQPISLPPVNEVA